MLYAAGIIDPQHSDRCAAFRCLAGNRAVRVQSKMIVPPLLTRMVKPGCFTCSGIKGGDI